MKNTRRNVVVEYLDYQIPSTLIQISIEVIL